MGSLTTNQEEQLRRRHRLMRRVATSGHRHPIDGERAGKGIKEGQEPAGTMKDRVGSDRSYTASLHDIFNGESNSIREFGCLSV